MHYVILTGDYTPIQQDDGTTRLFETEKSAAKYKEENDAFDDWQVIEVN